MIICELLFNQQQIAIKLTAREWRELSVRPITQGLMYMCPFYRLEIEESNELPKEFEG